MYIHSTNDILVFATGRNIQSKRSTCILVTLESILARKQKVVAIPDGIFHSRDIDQ